MDIEVSISDCLAEAAAQIIKRFRDLALISVVPALIIACVTAAGVHFQIKTLDDFISTQYVIPANPLDGGLALFIFLGQIVYFLATAWLLVKIVRLRLSNEAALFLTSNKEATATLYMCLYLVAYAAILIVAGGVLFVAVYAFSMIASAQPISWESATGFTHPGTIWSAQAHNSTIVNLFMLVAIFSFGIAGTIFTVRFFTALPAVAVGFRPNIFTFMIKFGQGKSWVIIGWLLLVGLLVTIANFFVTVLIFQFLKEAALQGPAVLLAFMKDNYLQLMAINIGLVLLTLPLQWFLVLFFTEIYQRISKFRTSRGLPFASPEQVRGT